MTGDQREIQRKLRVLRHAERIGCVSKTCQYFDIAPSSFFRWRAAYRERVFSNTQIGERILETGRAGRQGQAYNHRADELKSRVLGPQKPS